MVAVAFLGLFRPRLPVRILDAPVAALKAAHSGIAADYVVWMTLGTAVIGGIWALTLR
jgi:hypothetical protein